MKSMRNRVGLALGVVALSVGALGAHAEEGRLLRSAVLPKYKQECSSCHVAFPAGLLPAASWQRVMGGLSKHFGTDASLDAASQREIAAWLEANAGSGRRGGEEAPQDRITKSAWFQRQHRDGEVPANVWKRASVGSPANCAACHPRADQNNYSEHEVKIPK
jgi:hypothetical protein